MKPAWVPRGPQIDHRFGWEEQGLRAGMGAPLGSHLCTQSSPPGLQKFIEGKACVATHTTRRCLGGTEEKEWNRAQKRSEVFWQQESLNKDSKQGPVRCVGS